MKVPTNAKKTVAENTVKEMIDKMLKAVFRGIENEKDFPDPGGGWARPPRQYNWVCGSERMKEAVRA